MLHQPASKIAGTCDQVWQLSCSSPAHLWLAQRPLRRSRCSGLLLLLRRRRHRLLLLPWWGCWLCQSPVSNGTDVDARVGAAVDLDGGTWGVGGAVCVV